MSLLREDLCEHEWLRLEPYGLAMGTIATRPVFLLKSERHDLILPVWLSTRAAAESISMGSRDRFSPGGLQQKILRELGVSPHRAVFKSLEGETQWVEIYFKGSDRLKMVRAPAEQALPMALFERIPFFATREFILNCRQLNAEIFSEFHSRGHLDVVSKKDHPYLM